MATLVSELEIMLKQSRDISDQVPFKHLCELFERMSKCKTSAKRKVPLKKFVDQYARLTRNFYPVLRLMAPECDFERVYGIKERTLATMITQIYGIPKASADGKRLLKWREGEGDLPSVIHSVVLSRTTAKSVWTLKDVNTFLDELSDAKGTDAKVSIFKGIVSKLFAREIKWLCRILLKKLRYGTSLPPLLDSFCPRSSQAYTFRSNLKSLCGEIQKPQFCIEEIMKLKLFVPFQPMLSARSKPFDIPKHMHPPYFVETKYDGERVLIHKQKRKIKVFTRFLRDSTSLYLDALLTIQTSLGKNVESCILDGEILVWDEEKDCIEPFGGARAISTSGHSDGKHFFLMMFDILLLNGESFLNHKLEERKQLLNKVVKDMPTHIETVKHKECETVEEVVHLFRKANEAKEEGIVVKNPRSPYLPNARNREAWVKIKPDFVSNIAADLDVVILGGFYGEGGKTTGTLYTYLVGARNEDGSEYYPVGKVATGLSNRTRKLLLKALEDHWIKECPLNVFSEFDKPDVWISPEDSYVLEVRAMQVIPCEKRSSGVTFRCPRIEKLRPDKGCTDAITLKRLRSLIREQALLKEQGMKSTVRKTTKKYYKPITLPTNVENVPITSQIFHGKVFYVCGGAWRKKERKEYETIIHQQGGKFYQNFGPKVDYVVADKSTIQLKGILQKVQKVNQPQSDASKYETLRVVDLKKLLRERHQKVSGRKADLIQRLLENEKKKKQVSVVKGEWLKECANQHSLIDLKKEHVWTC